MSEHRHSFAVDCSCECGVMLSAYVKGLTAQARAFDSDQKALIALREADQATIASLELVNKELADALETIQFSDHRPSGLSQCPVCCCAPPKHAAGCFIASTLNRAGRLPS